MSPVDSLFACPRSAVGVLLAVTAARGGATYRGIAALLGIRSDSGVRQAVLLAKRAGLVHVVSGIGRYGRAIVYPTELALELLGQAGLQYPRNGEKT